MLHPHWRNRLYRHLRPFVGPDPRFRYNDVDVQGKVAYFVYYFLPSIAEEFDGGGWGDRGAVVCVSDYVGRGGDTVEEGRGRKGEAERVC